MKFRRQSRIMLKNSPLLLKNSNRKNRYMKNRCLMNMVRIFKRSKNKNLQMIIRIIYREIRKNQITDSLSILIKFSLIKDKVNPKFHQNLTKMYQYLNPFKKKTIRFLLNPLRNKYILRLVCNR